jgi:hypothetical protein
VLRRLPARNVDYTAGRRRGDPLSNFTMSLYPPLGSLNGTQRRESLDRGAGMGWRREIRDRIAELESRRLQLEVARALATKAPKRTIA